MTIISLDQLRANPEGFLAKIETGESVVLMRGSTKIAEIRPEISIAPGICRPSGLAKDAFVVPEDLTHRFLMTS